jgi:hypothetical protein
MLQALGEGAEEAQELLAEAAELAQRAEQGALPAPLLSKLGAVRAHLAAAPAPSSG